MVVIRKVGHGLVSFFNWSKYFTFFTVRTFTFPTFMAVITTLATTFSADYVRFIGHDVLRTYNAFR